MDTAQWPQEIVVKPIEEIVVVRNTTCPRPTPTSTQGVVEDHHHERKARPEKEQALNCPRCHSTNTKFCYYNNYSLTQPRYFCKTCRRYWTQGGSLRNIPVGGGSRKNKRSSYNSNSSSSIIIPPPPKNIKLSTIIPHNNNNNCCNDNNTPSNKLHDDEGQDLNLSFPNISELLVQQNNNNNNNTVASASASSSSSTTTTTTSHHHHNHNHNNNNHNFSALELISGITTTTTTFMPIPPPPPPPPSSSSILLPTTHDDPNINMGYTFPLVLHHHDFKPSSLNFSLDGICGSTSVGFGSLQEDTTSSGGRILFPFEDLKHVSTTTMDHNDNNNNNNNKEQQQEDHSTSGGYWAGMLGGGSW